MKPSFFYLFQDFESSKFETLRSKSHISESYSTQRRFLEIWKKKKTGGRPHADDEQPHLRFICIYNRQPYRRFEFKRQVAGHTRMTSGVSGYTRVTSSHISDSYNSVPSLRIWKKKKDRWPATRGWPAEWAATYMRMTSETTWQARESVAAVRNAYNYRSSKLFGIIIQYLLMYTHKVILCANAIAKEKNCSDHHTWPQPTVSYNVYYFTNTNTIV